MKILSLVTVNNPEVVGYLLEEKGTGDRTVYDVMMECVGKCLPVFVELYMVFLRTNYGFYVENFNGEEVVLSNNVAIECKIKSDILVKLKDLVTLKSSSELKTLLKCLQFLVALSNGNTRPHFRSYKYGSIVNRAFTEFQAQAEL